MKKVYLFLFIPPLYHIVRLYTITILAMQNYSGVLLISGYNGCNACKFKWCIVIHNLVYNFLLIDYYFNLSTQKVSRQD